MTVADILRKAADLIEPEGAWTQGAFGRTPNGVGTSSADSDAVCWCVAGAINKAARDLDVLAVPAHRLFERVIGGYNFTWNDHHQRTQAEVVAKLREAAMLSERDG
jgi:DnaJ-domain-containing protein 1